MAARFAADGARNRGLRLQKCWYFPVFALACAISLSAAAQDWPKRPVTILVPFDVGGSVDRMARGFAEFMPKNLGQPMTVVDRVGAGGQIGTTWFAHQPDDGYTVMLTPATPFLPINILVTGAKYTLDDFTFVNVQWIDYTVLFTPKERPFRTMGDLIEAIKAHPGKLSAGVSFGSVGHVTTMALIKALGLGADAIRVVTFDGAGATRTALAGGQVNFAIDQGEGSETIIDFIRPLAVFLDHRVPLFDAPPINEALRPFNLTMPLINGSVRTFVFPAGFKVKHPEDYSKFVAAYRKTLDDPEFRAWLTKNHMAGDWVGPEKTTATIYENFEALKEYKDLLKK
jgi:putative tricarboxylic transport membrane protein